jgi:hypothetical protein
MVSAERMTALTWVATKLIHNMQIVELDSSNSVAKYNIQKWEPVVKERQEKMKEEMLGKLKDLGNSVLGHFGMSLDNFKMEKDPNSGGYSIKMQQ